MNAKASELRRSNSYIKPEDRKRKKFTTAYSKPRAFRQLIVHICVNAQSIPVGANKCTDRGWLDCYQADYSTQVIQEASTGNNLEVRFSISHLHILFC